VYEFDSVEKDEIDPFLLYVIVGGVYTRNGSTDNTSAADCGMAVAAHQSVAVRRCGGK
jgi:hypothetical protein